MRRFDIDRRSRTEKYPTRVAVADKINIGAIVQFAEDGKVKNAKVLRQYSNGCVDTTVNGKQVSLKFSNDGWMLLNRVKNKGK